MSLDPNVVLSLLVSDGEQQVQALVSRLPDQVAYNDVATALAALSGDGLVEPTTSGRWAATSKGRDRLVG